MKKHITHISIFLLLISILTSCHSNSIEDQMELYSQYQDVFVTKDTSVISPSQDYELEKVVDYSDEVESFTFRVLDITGHNVVYQSEDYFRTRDTHFLLWGDDDTIWLYSGDVGVYYWKKESESNWIKYSYAKSEENIKVPQALKELRPRPFE